MKSCYLIFGLTILAVGVFSMDDTEGKTDIPAEDASKNRGVDPIRLIADAYAQHLYRVFDIAYGQVRRGFAQAVADLQSTCDCQKGDIPDSFIPPSARAPRPASANPNYNKENPRPRVSNNASPPL